MLNRRCVDEYNSLADVHLQAYFSNKNLLRHLRKSGLINKKREIVPESIYRANISRTEQKLEVKEALAQAIVHKSLDLQLKRESEIQNRLEEIAKLELVKKIRSERLQRCTLLTPPSRISSGRHPAWKYFTLYPNKHDSFPSSRPRTAHQRQTLRDSTSVTSVETGSYNDSCSESTATTLRDSDLQTKHAKGDAGSGVHLRKYDKTWQKKSESSFTKYDQDKIKMSPYLYPVPRTEKRTFKLFDIPNTARKMYHAYSSYKEEDENPRWRYGPQHVGSPDKATNMIMEMNIQRLPESMANKRTNCLVTLQYLGTGSNISWEEPSPGIEIVIQQQHCGGNPMCVYRGHHNTEEEFSFVSYRHLNFPYSLSIYLAGILYTRVSACCEYRHRRGTRIGGPQGLFSLVNVQGASPCARCQVHRQMIEEKKKKRPKTDTKSLEEDQTNVESTAPSLIETQLSEENKKEIERDENTNATENQEALIKKDNEEDQKWPIPFTVSGTVINVEESSSDEDEDYQDDFEEEAEEKEAKKEEKEAKKEEKERKETNDKELENEEVVKDEDGSSEDGSSEDTSSSETEDDSVPSEEDERVEGEKDAIKNGKVGNVETKEVSDASDETSSIKSKDGTSSEEGDDYEDDFHKDNETKDETSDTEMEANKKNSRVQSSSLDKNGKEEKDKESAGPEDSSENVEEETKENKDSVELLKQQGKGSSINSEVAQESAGKTESDITGRSNSTSSKESSSSLPPASRRKSKMKPERRPRFNNRKNTPSSSSESDSIAHLPAELEGTEKAKNWVPASQQETL